MNFVHDDRKKIEMTPMADFCGAIMRYDKEISISMASANNLEVGVTIFGQTSERQFNDK